MVKYGENNSVSNPRDVNNRSQENIKFKVKINPNPKLRLMKIRF